MLRHTLRRGIPAVPPPPPIPAIPSELVPKARPGRIWASSSSSAAAAAKFAAASKQQRPGAAATSFSQQPSLLPFTPRSTKASDVFAQGTAIFRETEAAVQHFESHTKPYKNGWFSVPEIDYNIAAGGISPLMSPTQAQLLRDVHHAGIVRRLNDLTFGTEYEGHPLDTVILHTSFDAENAAIHSAACEHWNHTLMWRSLVPFGAAASSKFRHVLTTSPLKQQSGSPVLLDPAQDGSAQRAASLALLTDGMDKCKRMLSNACRDAAASGGGWVFLVTTQAGQCFEVVRYRPGLSPVTAQLTPLVCINMQLHARYVDYGLFGSSSSGGGAGTQQLEESSMVQNYIDNALRAVNWKVAEIFWRRAAAVDDEDGDFDTGNML